MAVTALHRESTLIAFFRYSTPRYSAGIRFAGAVALQLLGAAALAGALCLLDSFWEKPTAPLVSLIVGLTGTLIGFHGVALVRPLANRRIGFVAASLLIFATFYWLVSSSLPDLLLSRLFYGCAVGALAAMAFRWCFLEPPVIPRVP